jgi:hypothetical protein
MKRGIFIAVQFSYSVKIHNIDRLLFSFEKPDKPEKQNGRPNLSN